jgi:hypothetical protein
LGDTYNDQRGCWDGIDSDDPSKETHVCAWDKSQRLYLGPTPVEHPRLTLAWGERQGMYARIISSSGLDTEHASITAEKSREGAVIWCRVNHDYSIECIRHTLEDDTQSAPEKAATLHANCKTKKYTDFVGRNLQALADDILDLDNNVKVSTYAGGTAVAIVPPSKRCVRRLRRPSPESRQGALAIATSLRRLYSNPVLRKGV